MCDSTHLDTAATLAGLAHDLLRRLNSTLLGSFLQAWPSERQPRRTPAPNPAPVSRVLPGLAARAPDFSARFLAALAEARDDLCWGRTYRKAEVGAAFLDGYAYTELVGLAGALPSPRLACGVLLLAPELTYPSHRHEAEEIYVPLAGTSSWQRGTEAWRVRQPGDVIHHVPYQSHAMRTYGEAMLAMYLWRSEDLAQEAQLV